MLPCYPTPKSFERSGVHRLVNRQRLPLQEGPSGQEGGPLHEWNNLSQVRWDCKSHVVILPKSRRNVFSGRLRRQIGEVLRELCRQRGSGLVAGQALPDHVHLCLSTAPSN